MSELKKYILLVAVVGIAALNVVIYWNFHLFYKAEKMEEPDKKVEVLERASKLYPFNDLIYHELGKAYFNVAEDHFGDNIQSLEYIDRSIDAFIHAIRINPASHFSHFHLAKSYLYREVLSPTSEHKYIDEYKRAALLVSRFTDIYFNVGVLLLSRWNELSAEDKDFTREMLREIWRIRDRAKILSVLQTWEMNARDYEIIESILPEDGDAYYTYAKYLGERSLDVGERHKYLARYEWKEFAKAKEFYDTGERDFFYYRIGEAKQNFLSCMKTLERIKFFQDITNHELIDPAEFLNVRRSALLNLAKCFIEERQDWAAYEGYLREYLGLENRVSAFNELESYLVEKNLFTDRLGADFEDLDRLSFQILLYIKQNRFGEIVRLGRNIQSSLIVIPDEKKTQYLEILQIIGDAFQKNGSFYGARDFYQQALEIEPGNIGTLLRLRKNLMRLNGEARVRDVDRRIAGVLSPKEIRVRNKVIQKGKAYSQSLLFDGNDIALDLHFINIGEDPPPLVTVTFNGRVMWEDYLSDRILSVLLETKEGENNIQVTAVNRPVTLSRITWKLNNIK